MKFTVPMSSGQFKIRHTIGLVLYSLENFSRTVVYSCIIGIENLYVNTSCKLAHEYHGIGSGKFSGKLFGYKFSVVDLSSIQGFLLKRTFLL